jgi:hypothetical protein
MSAAIDAIGLVSGVLGIVSFFQDNISAQPPQGATVRVKAGLEGGDEDASTVSLTESFLDF